MPTKPDATRIIISHELLIALAERVLELYGDTDAPIAEQARVALSFAKGE